MIRDKKYLMRNAMRLLFVVVLIEVVLLFSNLVPANLAVVLIAMTELVAFLIGGTILVGVCKQVANAVKEGAGLDAAIQKAFKGVIPGNVLIWGVREIGVFISIARFITHKKDIPKQGIEIKYGSSLRKFISFLVVISVIEIVAVELLIPIKPLRIIVLILSIYSLLWIIGLLFSTIVYPHYVEEHRLVLRFFHFHTVVVPVGIGERVIEINRSAVQNKTIEHFSDGIALNVLQMTNIELIYPQGTQITINGDSCTVHRVCFNVDNPKEFRAYHELHCLATSGSSV